MSAADDDMCDNCVTPWKCNGPHWEVADDSEVAEVAGRVAERWAGALKILAGAERPMTLADFLLARVAEDEERAKAPLGDETYWQQVHPVRVLAECEAKRRIVEAWLEADRFYAANTADPSGELHGLATAARAIALPYADHPDYAERWRP